MEAGGGLCRSFDSSGLSTQRAKIARWVISRTSLRMTRKMGKSNSNIRSNNKRKGESKSKSKYGDSGCARTTRNGDGGFLRE